MNRFYRKKVQVLIDNMVYSKNNGRIFDGRFLSRGKKFLMKLIMLFVRVNYFLSLNCILRIDNNLNNMPGLWQHQPALIDNVLQQYKQNPLVSSGLINNKAYNSIKPPAPLINCFSTDSFDRILHLTETQKQAL